MGPFWLNEVKPKAMTAESPDIARFSAGESEMRELMTQMETALIKIEEKLTKQDDS